MAHTVFSDKMAGPLNEPPSPATARPKSPNRYVLKRGAICRSGFAVGPFMNYQLFSNLTLQRDGLQNFGSAT
jgi:hypothetical protein